MDAPARANIQKLLDVVPDPSARLMIAGLLRRAIPALQSLDDIDKSIDNYCAFFKNDMGQALEMIIPEVRASAFKGVRGVIAYLTAKDLVAGEGQDEEEEESESQEDGDFDFGDDLDFGAFDEPADTAEEETESLLAAVDEFDIDAAVDFIDPGEASAAKKIKAMNKEISFLAHALRDQLNVATEQIEAAYESGKHEVVMRELDMGRESLTEGLFALLTFIFELFLGGCDRTALLPGYRDVLQKSLLIRRGIAELTRSVRVMSRRIQDETKSAAVREAALRLLIDVLNQFKRSDIFQVMRTLDRWELTMVYEDLTKASLAEASFAAEGLLRYLESLSVINQREVLLQHDQETIENIRELLVAARSLTLISVAGAKSQLEEALQSAERLYGRSELLDDQLEKWKESSLKLETQEEVEAIIERLEELI